jgi:iron complex outermembrane recepter protein
MRLTVIACAFRARSIPDQDLTPMSSFSARSCAGVLLIAQIGIAGTAQAQQPRSTDSTSRTSQTLAPVTVTATREAVRRTAVSTTIDVLDGSEIRRTRAGHPGQLLNRIPGVRVSELSGEGHSMAIRQPITTKPMYLYLEDGIPTRATGFFNHNALYEVNIPQSNGIEVLKGPGTALYGSDAIGGVVNVFTRGAPATPQAEISLETGRFGYGRILATGGFLTGRQGVRADLNVTRTDGWRDGSGFTRRSGTLRHDTSLPGGWSTKTVLTASSIDQNDVPSLQQAQFDDWSAINRAPIAFRNVRALRVSSAIERNGGTSLLSITPFFRRNELGLLPNWQLTFNPQVWQTNNDSYGMLLKYRRDFTPWRTRIIAGADLDLSPGDATIDQIAAPRDAAGFWTSFTRTSRSYDYDVTYRQASPYLHAEFSPATTVRIDVGARYDVVGYSYDSKLAALQTGSLRRPADTTLSYRRVSPKVGVTWDVTHGLNVYASYREGFRAPSQGQLFQQGAAQNTVGLRPVRARSSEIGFRGELAQRFVWQLAAYDMRISDDIFNFVTADNQRVATNAGRTRHRGIELSSGVVMTKSLRLDGSFSIAEQRYLNWTPQAARPAVGTTPAVAAVDFSGKLIEQAPRTLANALLSWQPRRFNGGRVAAEWTMLGRYAMDPQNLQFYNGFSTVNLHANVNIRSDVEVFFRGVNMLNRRFAELATFNPAERNVADQFQYTPGSPRTVFAGLRYTLQ